MSRAEKVAIGNHTFAIYPDMNAVLKEAFVSPKMDLTRMNL